MIARGRYIRGGTANQASAASHLNSHLKYLERRSRDEQESREDRSIFSKDDDQVNRRDAVDDVMEHTSGSVSYHKIVLSPGDDEPVQDWLQAIDQGEPTISLDMPDLEHDVDLEH